MSHTLKAVDRVESACTLHHKAHFQGFFGLGGAKMPPKWAQNGLISPVGAPQMVSDEFWETAFLTHF